VTPFTLILLVACPVMTWLGVFVSWRVDRCARRDRERFLADFSAATDRLEKLHHDAKEAAKALARERAALRAPGTQGVH